MTTCPEFIFPQGRRCGITIPTGTRRCPSCTARLDEERRRAAADAAIPEAQRMGKGAVR